MSGRRRSRGADENSATPRSTRSKARSSVGSGARGARSPKTPMTPAEATRAAALRSARRRSSSGSGKKGSAAAVTPRLSRRSFSGLPLSPPLGGAASGSAGSGGGSAGSGRSSGKGSRGGGAGGSMRSPLASTPGSARSRASDVSASPYPREQLFFDFCPLRFVDDLYNAVADYVADATDALEAAVVERFDLRSGSAARERVRSGCDELLPRMLGEYDKNFDKLEMYALRNIFKIPDEVDVEVARSRLSALGVVASPAPAAAADADGADDDEEEVTVEQDAELDREMAGLLERIHAARRRRRALQTAVGMFEKRLPACEEEDARLDAPATALAKAGAWPPEKSMTAVVENCKRLQEVAAQLTELRSAMGLAASSEGNPGQQAARARRRGAEGASDAADAAFAGHRRAAGRVTAADAATAAKRLRR